VHRSHLVLPLLIGTRGENGSGKSTLTKLLTRQHEPSTGTLHIDGQPARAFKRAALREATAALSQEHDLFAGLSVADDVALGHWHARERSALVADSLHLGGAAPVVAKLAAGADTVLRPRDTKGCVGLASGHALWGVYDKLEKSASVSGGELQRLVA
jgi:ABC-type multidrug transport system fused ATPase/permease subunit